MRDVPRVLSRPGDTTPVPRRIRAYRGGRCVVDTTAAQYHWEHQWYPRWLLPTDAVDSDVARAAEPAGDGLVHVAWDAADAWFEEDEQVFVHPRSPYVRVDALRSTRHVRVELDGVVLAESRTPVLVFETGLPTRYYLPMPDVRLEHLESSSTETACPYKGRTTAYWSARVGETLHDDVAWLYDFPTRELLPIAGLVAFYNEQVDLTVDGIALPRPRTKFS